MFIRTLWRIPSPCGRRFYRAVSRENYALVFLKNDQMKCTTPRQVDDVPSPSLGECFCIGSNDRAMTIFAAINRDPVPSVLLLDFLVRCVTWIPVVSRIPAVRRSASVMLVSPKPGQLERSDVSPLIDPDPFVHLPALPLTPGPLLCL